MSGPYYTSVTLVSGRKDANEILFVSGIFVYCMYNSLTLVSGNPKSSTVTDQNLAPLLVFNFLLHLEYLDKVLRLPLAGPENARPSSLFWLALDSEGFDLAKKIFTKYDVDFTQTVYKHVKKLNLIEKAIPPYPYLPKSIWEKVLEDILIYQPEYRMIRSPIERREFLNRKVNLSPEAKAYVGWLQAVKDIMTPWRKIIQGIQSDWS